MELNDNCKQQAQSPDQISVWFMNWNYQETQYTGVRLSFICNEGFLLSDVLCKLNYDSCSHPFSQP